MTARDPVYAALALEPRVACPFEVGGIRMNLAQLRHTLAQCIYEDPAALDVQMTEHWVGISWTVPVVYGKCAEGGWAVHYEPRRHSFARTIRDDGVSVVDVPQFKAKGPYFSFERRA